MRIRKQAKSSSLLHATSNLKPEAAIQTHVCPLNQSPWDVITTFSPPSSPIPPTPPPLQEWDNMLVDGYGSSMHFSSAAQSRGFNIGQELESKDVEDHQQALCCKTDGKSWKCRRVAVKGNSLCEHHLAQVRSYYSNNSNTNTNTVQESDSKKKKKKKKKQQTVETGTKPLEGINVNPRPSDKPKKALGSSSSSSKPYEYYYYSGFGPHWGRKRGGSRCNGDDNINGDANITEHERHETSRRVAAADIDDDDEDESDSNKSEESAAAQEPAGLYIDEDDDGEEDEDVMGGQNVKKRPRKQIKARSLKSLM